MSKHETPMTRWYWGQVGGLLLEEYLVVPKAPDQGQRLLDGLIILGKPSEIASRGTPFDICGHDVVCIQAKNSRLGMHLMGQALFSRDLVRSMGARSVVSVALCTASDRALAPLLEAHDNCFVIVCPPAAELQSVGTPFPLSGRPPRS